MRKIKLMALLLAALMIVTAFAGCAGVKQEVVDGLDDRVSKIEDLLLQQNDTIKDLGDKVGNVSDNSDILAAIESMNKDLSDKIADLDSRVEDVEKQPAVGGVDTNVQAEQTKALAKIDVEKAKFNKNVTEYDEDTFAAITSALAKAQAEVTAATTVEGVAAAMATLTKALEEYKTYAMKLKDIYDALLGNINGDAEELVENAEAFIDVIDEVYAELVEDENENGSIEDEKADALAYTVVEATATSKAKTLDVYSSVKALIQLYNEKSTKKAGETAAAETFKLGSKLQYVEKNGDKVYVRTVGDSNAVTVYSVAGFKKAADDLSKAIVGAVTEDGLTYAQLVELTKKGTSLVNLQTQYENYVKGAELIGGKALVDLVKNVELLTEALELTDKLFDARDAYAELNGRDKTGAYLDGFYYYMDATEGAGKYDGLVIADPDDKSESLFLEDFYSDYVDDVIADWADEFDLSDEDIAAIINEKENKDAGTTGDDYYGKYLQIRRRVSLYADAYDKFLKDVVPNIKKLNANASESAESIELFNSIKAAVADLVVLQEKDTKSENIADQQDVTLTSVVFGEFVEQSGIFNVTDTAMKGIKDLENGVDTYLERRLTAISGLTLATDATAIDSAKFANLFTFAADVKDLDAAAKNDADKYYVNNGIRVTGDVHDFFANKYVKVETYANEINKAIAYLVKYADVLPTNKDFVKLAGDYVTLDKADNDFKIVYAKGTTSEVTYYNQKDLGADAEKAYNAADLYVLAADAIDYSKIGTGEGESFKAFDADTDLFDADTGLANLNNTAVIYNALRTNEKDVDEDASPVLSISFFNYAFPEFASLIHGDELETARKAVDARLQKLFDDVDLLEEALAKIDYVRLTNGKGSKAYIYNDLNGNGVNDFGDEFPYDTNRNGIMDDEKEWPEAKHGETTVDLNTISINDANVNAVSAAFKAYNEWTFAGGKTSLEIFGEKLDDQSKAISGLYEMKGFGDADGVGAILKTLRELNTEIEKIKAEAKKFTDVISLIVDVNKYNSISVTASTNKLAGDANLDRYAIYDFAKPTATGVTHKTYDGTYYFITETETGFTKTGGSATVSGADKESDALSALGTAVTKVKLMKAAVEYYDAFYKLNKKYVAATNNNYDSTDDNSVTFYALEEYDAGYSAVENAKKTYEGTETESLQLVAARAACVEFTKKTDIVKAVTDKGIDANVMKSFTDQIYTAPSISALAFAMDSYNALVDDKYDIKPADLAGWTIHDFKNLEVTGK